MPNLRVIAGKYKGLKLASPQLSTTHPMGAREKNALFNMLQPWIPSAKVLDAYAGTGALGIEALSRGASSASFVEQQPAVVRTLRSNLASLAEPTNVLVSTVANATHQLECQGYFDIIIADPPYDDFNLAEIEMLVNLLAPTGIIALSFPAKLGNLKINRLQLITVRYYAGAGISLYQKKS